MPSATTSAWTPFQISYCNCKIQDGVHDGRRGYATTLKKTPRKVKHSVYTLQPVGGCTTGWINYANEPSQVALERSSQDVCEAPRHSKAAVWTV